MTMCQMGHVKKNSFFVPKTKRTKRTKRTPSPTSMPKCWMVRWDILGRVEIIISINRMINVLDSRNNFVCPLTPEATSAYLCQL